MKKKSLNLSDLFDDDNNNNNNIFDNDNESINPDIPIPNTIKTKDFLLNISSDDNNNNNKTKTKTPKKRKKIKMRNKNNSEEEEDRNDSIKSKEENNINIEEYLKIDFDEMYYEDAVKKDKRTFCELFIKKLKINQKILYIFISNHQLRPRVIKIMLFIIEISFYLFFNALFFNEEYISKVYNSTKKEKFFTFFARDINRIIYTILIGILIGFIIEYSLFIDESQIKRIFKIEKNNNEIIESEMKRLIKCITIYNTGFIILSFIIIIFIGYYTTCFNNIYRHMVVEWIKSSIIIIFIMQILSILACLLESIFRFFGLKFKKKKIYKISYLFGN